MKSNKKIKVLIFYCLTWASYAMAQQHPVATGGNGAGSGGSFSYSIGQIDYVYASGTNGNSLQGVQQPFEIFSVGTEEFPIVMVEINAYPNPVNDALILNIQHLPLGNCVWSMFDMNGKMLRSMVIQDNLSCIPMHELTTGEYILTISINEQKIKSFKIIKNQ